MAKPLDRDQRIELARQAHLLRAQRRTQREIADALGVSQPTVCNWLKRPPSGLTARGRIAEKIRAELVCCDIYQRMEDVNNPEDDSAWKALRHSRDYHDICFFGEWAARIAEQAK